MKKRIYLIGAVLILLAIIATDTYLNNKRNNAGKRDIAQAAPAADGVVATTGDNEQARGIANEQAEQVAVTATSTKTTRKSKHRGPVRHTNSANEYAVADNNEVTYTTKKSTEMTVEVPNTYLGYKPVAKPVIKIEEVKKNNRRPFHLPNHLGLEIGYNQNYLINNTTLDMSVGGFHAGLLYDINIGNHFAIQPGVRYINKGNKLQDNMDVATQEKLVLRYVEVPVNMVVKIGKIGNTRFMAGAGPYASYLVGTKHKFQTRVFSDASDVLPGTPEYNTNDINTFDWGLGGFVGCQSPDGLFAKVGGEVGMMDITKDKSGKDANRNASIMFTVGYIIGGR